MRRVVLGILLAVVLAVGVWLVVGPPDLTRTVTFAHCIDTYHNPPGDQSRCVPNTPEQQAKQDAERARLRATTTTTLPAGPR